jgi:hypothetical protein
MSAKERSVMSLPDPKKKSQANQPEGGPKQHAIDHATPIHAPRLLGSVAQCARRFYLGSN